MPCIFAYEVQIYKVWRSFEVGDGAAYLQHAAVGAGAEFQLVDRDFEQFFRLWFHGAVALDVPRPHLRVGVEPFLLKARELDHTGAVDALADRRRR